MAMFPAQVHPLRLARLQPGERLHRLAALATELYDDQDHRLVLRDLAADMQVTYRTVRRWRSMDTVVPLSVLAALGAMVAAKRGGV